MPTLFTHAFVSAAAGRLYARGEEMGLDFWAYGALVAVLPDADVLGLAAGVPYGSTLGHRGLSHSLMFAAAAGAFAAWRVGRQTGRAFKPLWGYFCLVAASHGVLDAFTDGGRGIAFLAPFTNARYFFPWRPVRVSPIGGGFFTPRGLETVRSELLWVWLPLIVVMAVSAWRGNGRAQAGA